MRLHHAMYRDLKSSSAFAKFKLPARLGKTLLAPASSVVQSISTNVCRNECNEHHQSGVEQE